MTAAELIERLKSVPADAEVMCFDRMDDPQFRGIENVEAVETTDGREVVVLG
jgi:hypothetical protein